MSLIHDYGFLADANSNLSLPGAFEPSALVIHPLHGEGVVDHETVVPTDPRTGTVIYTHNGTTHASGFTYMTTVDFYKNRKLTVSFEELTKFDVGDFMFWRQPNGQWMHGNNDAIGQGLRYLLFLGFIVYSATQLQHSWGWIAGILLPLGIIGLMLLGVARNFHGKQM